MQRIKTNIKFNKGLEGNESRLYGFVTKINGSWRGCRETDEYKKKIVFVDDSLTDDIIPNALYHCSLIPMKCEGGFIAVSASMVRFKANVDTISQKNNFIVRVTFGNKQIVYDPASKEKRKRDISVIAEKLRSRKDLANPHRVAEDFIDSACIIRNLYNQNKTRG